MSLTITLPEQYGWVVLSGAISVFAATYLGTRVSAARKTHNVPYPTMYSPDNVVFNCIQRGHQNMLEQHYAILFFMGISGLYTPVLSSSLGLAWTLGRILYFFQYSTGNPSKRIQGYIFIAPALLGLFGATIYTGLKMLKAF